MENNKKPTFGQYFDLNLWKNLQDNFSYALNLPLATINKSGDRVITSKDLPFFCQIVNSKETGNELCKKCRAKHYQILESKQPLVYTCHAGLSNIMVPVKLNDSQVAVKSYNTYYVYLYYELPKIR